MPEGQKRSLKEAPGSWKSVKNAVRLPTVTALTASRRIPTGNGAVRAIMIMDLGFIILL